jgi:hypothetical protein
VTSIPVLRAVRALAEAGEIRFSSHALLDSMPDDGVFRHDVEHALVHAHDVLAQDGEGRKWKVTGPLVNGDEYAVVVNVYADHVFVVTCHYPP